MSGYNNSYSLACKIISSRSISRTKCDSALYWASYYLNNYNNSLLKMLWLVLGAFEHDNVANAVTAASYFALFSFLGTFIAGEMSPITLSPTSWQSAILIILSRSNVVSGHIMHSNAVRYMWSLTDYGEGIFRSTHPVRSVRLSLLTVDKNSITLCMCDDGTADALVSVILYKIKQFFTLIK